MSIGRRRPPVKGDGGFFMAAFVLYRIPILP